MFGYKLWLCKQETVSSEMGQWASFAMQKSCASAISAIPACPSSPRQRTFGKARL